MWNIESRAIAWEDNTSNEEYGSEQLTDSDFDSHAYAEEDSPDYEGSPGIDEEVKDTLKE